MDANSIWIERAHRTEEKMQAKKEKLCLIQQLQTQGTYL